MHILGTGVTYNTEDGFPVLFISAQRGEQHQPCIRHFPALCELQQMLPALIVLHHIVMLIFIGLFIVTS